MRHPAGIWHTVPDASCWPKMHAGLHTSVLSAAALVCYEAGNGRQALQGGQGASCILHGHACFRSVRSAVIVHAAAGVFGGDVLRTTLGPRTAATTQIHTILLSWLLQRVLLAHASRLGRGAACMPSYVVCQLLLRKPHCADMCALCEATLQHFARMPL